MESVKSNPKPVIGFLTVVEHPQHGLFGGYLILNMAGRPVEFHCTAPVKPNRAQEILYGPTLDAFLYGEQIGSTLLGHAKSSAAAILTDREPVLALGELTELPVALVLPPEETVGAEQVRRGSPDPAEVRRGSPAPPRFGAGLLTPPRGHGRETTPNMMETTANMRETTANMRFGAGLPTPPRGRRSFGSTRPIATARGCTASNWDGTGWPSPAPVKRPQAACRTTGRRSRVARFMGAVHAHSPGHRGSPAGRKMNDPLYPAHSVCRSQRHTARDPRAGARVPGAGYILHWQPPPAPEVVSWDLAFKAEAVITGWNRALERSPNIEVTSVPLAAARPRAIQVPIRRAAIRVRSFFFPEPTDINPAQAYPTDSVCRSQRHTESAGYNYTRIRPPEDVIKLEDRLSYLLEPPLESLLDDRALAMPFRPFPFQFEGVAFLYPRHAAILADEMGLGKTMQAITAIRLLLRRGEVRSVLLVCPKPLVTNWQREFHLWAPEVPTLTIEGDQARRAWQWQLADVPVRIANYEVVVRDREILDGPAMATSRPEHAAVPAITSRPSPSIWSSSTSLSGSRIAAARPVKWSAGCRAAGPGR